MYIGKCRWCYTILRNVLVQNVSKMIIQGTFNDWLELMIETSNKYLRKLRKEILL